ncbi:YfbU family protein [Limisalsivibrio acetivorans]|uniref:YfbU family protein n=1 Tax=Limisalsivibrio acetivorans TaxID=1304888 RepID=UPI0003B42255|nr:YfbU family protein [Limisalsivibrio acetivorans]
MKEHLTLTKKDRLILINQYKILKELTDNDIEERQYDKNIEILLRGYELEFEYLCEFDDNIFERKECEKVLAILNLYRVITNIVNQNDYDEVKEHSRFLFEGFDGNNETEYLRYAKFYLEDPEKFEELSNGRENDSFNSHSPMLNVYERMLDEWENIPTVKKYQLTKEEILRILDAGNNY